MGSTRRQFLSGAAAGGGFLLSGCGGNATHTLRRARDLRSRARDTHHFVSRPDLKPPRVTVLRAGATAPGLLFSSPSSGPGQRGVLILDHAGEPVWFHPTPHRAATNFRVGTYEGQPVLSWWEGKTVHGLGDGDHVIVDGAYRELARFPAGGGLAADLHELILTADDTALVAAWDLRTLDVPGHGRKQVVEGVVQELAIPSARVLWQWRSLDHVALAESYAGVGRLFDYFHLNSIDVDGDGDLLVSARNTWGVYKVARRDGRVLWRLGGRKSDFAQPRPARFAWQHDARHQADGTLTIFDNGTSPQIEPQSRGIRLALDARGRRASLVRAYTHRPPVSAHIFGSVQTQPNGNVLVGWGAGPYVTEYTAAGAVVYDATLPHGGQSYRTLRYPWAGRPVEPPVLVASGGRLYASWNGSTETAYWRVLAGSGGSLAAVSTTPRRGFETVLPRPAGASHAAVEALGADRAPLARSATIAL